MKELSEETMNSIIDLSKEIKARIQAYADKNKISYEEAEKRARISVGSEFIKVSVDKEEI